MIIIIGGSSGSGKNALVDALRLPLVISATTRKIREGETNGEQYIFVTGEEFEQLIADGEFAEHKYYIGNGLRYGTLKESIEPYIDLNEDACHIVDVQGLRALKALYGDKVLSFYIYADKDICEKRMRRRGDSEELLQQRLLSWEEEVKTAEEYDIVLPNPYGVSIETLAEMVKEIVTKKRTLDAEKRLTHTNN